MFWKSLSTRACTRLLGFSSKPRARFEKVFLGATGNRFQHRRIVKGVVGAWVGR